MEVAQETALNPELSAILEQAMFAGQFDPQILSLLTTEEAIQIRDALWEEGREITDATKDSSDFRKPKKTSRIIRMWRKLLVIINLENQILSKINKPEDLKTYFSIQNDLAGAIRGKIKFLEGLKAITTTTREKVRKTNDPEN